MDWRRSYEQYQQRCSEVSSEDQIDLTSEDYLPFDHVTISRVLDDRGEPTELVDIEGLRQGGAREVRVRYLDLWQQIGVHLETFHDKTLDDPAMPQEFAHATVRAAIAFLID